MVINRLILRIVPDKVKVFVWYGGGLAIVVGKERLRDKKRDWCSGKFLAR